MGTPFASGKRAIAICDRCGFQFKLKQLRKEVVKTKVTGALVCQQCWSPDHPQLLLGMYPVNDPQALREPRNDTTYYTAGTGPDGGPTSGSRQIQWGWAPAGGPNATIDPMTPNSLVAVGSVGDVTIVTT